MHFLRTNILVKITLYTFLIVGVGVFSFHKGSLAQVNNRTAPVITDISIAEVKESEVRILWETDKESDSMVNFGLDKRYGIIRLPGTSRTDHELTIGELKPSTTYHFRVVSSDASGNQSISGDFQFTTKGIVEVEDIERVESREQRAVVEQAVAQIDEITDVEALDIVIQKIQQVASGITDDLTIIGTPDVEPRTTTAVVRWVTNRPSDSTASFVSEDDYNPQSSNPYTSSQSSNDENVTDHQVTIIGLEPFTVYRLQVSSRDQFGIVGKSKEITFTTKSVLPNITNIDLEKIEETSATIVWNTTVPAKSLIDYENLDTGEIKSLGSPSLATSHSLRLSDLTLGTQYRAIITAENAGGERVSSDPITFVTIIDEEPPVISKVTNESTLFPGSEARIQTIISWETDEPSLCNFFYHQGLVPGVVPEQTLPRKDDNYKQEHVQVVVDFAPSTVYKFWVMCEDASENESRSEDFVLFTPEKEKNIIDIILENFEGTFGWVQDIGA
ncbi:MAG: fibronectin type III domain-containing protein [Candidatus Paceibacterota bacterium]